MTTKPIKTALIGAGFIGRLHARNLSHHPGIALAYVAEPFEEQGRSVAAAAGATWIATPDAALADPEVEAVWIASPAATHSELIRRAVKAGKAVFCEKPIGMDMPDVIALSREVATFARPIMVGFNRRFDASHARLKELVASGKVGEVEMVTITSRDPNPPPIDYMKATPGGIFYDTMIHDFDIARWLLGEEPTEVYATASCHLDATLNPDQEFDAATAILRTKSGAVCQIAASRRATYGYDQRIEVFGSKGMVQSENHNLTNVTVYERNSIWREPLKAFFTDRYTEAYVQEIDRFVSACRGESTDYPGILDGQQALYLSLEALASARAGQPVALSPDAGG